MQRQLNLLHAELAATQQLDADTRAMLESVAADIERTLEGQADQSLRERIESATLKFEASHPRFARIFSEVTDALAKIGL